MVAISTKIKREIVYIDIEDLVIDDTNIRKEIQQPSLEDLDLIKSIKKLGVVQNLTVRPIKIQGEKKYGIICGSRRYFASVKAGLKNLPCRVLELDDISAMGLSFTENENRRDIPRWRVIEWIVEMNKKINPEGSTDLKFLTKLSKKSALATQTIKRYLNIGKLPSSLKILLKKHHERNDREKEILKKYIQYNYTKVELTIGIAGLIIDNLLDLPEERLLEHAIDLTRYPFEGVKEIIEHLKKDPDQSVDDVVHSIIKQSTKFRSITLYLEKELYNNLEELCLKRRIKLYDLIPNLIKEGLKSY